MANLEKIFDFLHTVTKLKSTFRFSTIKNMPKESSAAHSWRLALMAFIVADELNLNIDVERALKIAIVHDIAESVCGDIDYMLIVENKVSKEKKQRLEREAIKKLKNSLPSKVGEEIYNLWNEYEKGSTREAKFIKALDKLETLTHLIETGHKTYDDPKIIAGYANQAVKNFPELTDILKIIKRKLKSEFLKGNIQWKKEYDNLD